MRLGEFCLHEFIQIVVQLILIHKSLIRQAKQAFCPNTKCVDLSYVMQLSVCAAQGF